MEEAWASPVPQHHIHKMKECERQKLINIFQVTVTAEDNGLRGIVDSFFPEPPIGPGEDEIPADDDTVPPTFYYNRERPVWNEIYESSKIVVYCK